MQTTAAISTNILPPLPVRASILDWCRLSGMSRSETYRRLAAGDLEGVKIGRSLLLDVPAGLAWMASLPKATFRATGGAH